MPVLEISLLWTVRQLISLLVFRSTSYICTAPGHVMLWFVRRLWSPKQKGTANGASARCRFGSKCDLQAEMTVALVGHECSCPGLCSRDWEPAYPRVKMKEKKDLRQPFTASPKEHLWPKNCGESALGNWRRKYVEKSWQARFTCTALHEATFKECSVSI